MITEDEYRDLQLNKYLDEQDYLEEVSPCCGANICDETDICCDCREHCNAITRGDYIFNQMAALVEDIRDVKYEESRDD